MRLWEDPAVGLILPPWGGEFLMDMLPLLDFDQLGRSVGTWVSGYSDVTTLLFPLTLRAGIATVHGSNLMNMGGRTIHPSDLRLLEAVSQTEITQQSAGMRGTFEAYNDLQAEPYAPMTPDRWTALDGRGEHAFSGRVLGGCLEVLRALVGTDYAPVEAFSRAYRSDGIVWVLESCEMGPTEIYRTLWQMRQAGWFSHAKGFIIGRPDGDTGPTSQGYAYVDALRQGLEGLDVPVLCDADVGHVPPQMQFINGAMAKVEYADGRATVLQRYVP